MSKLEEEPQWPEILRLKDELPLKALAARFGTTVGAISAALKRTGTPRKASQGRSKGDDLPPELGDTEEHTASKPASRRAPGRSRVEALHHLVGTVPDGEVAEKAEVSVGTVRNYRIKHGIPAARRRRRSTTTKSEPVAKPAAVVPTRAQPRMAWRVNWEVDGGRKSAVVVAASLLDAAAQVTAANVVGQVRSLEFVGDLLV